MGNPISAVGAVMSSTLARSSTSSRMKAMFEGLSSTYTTLWRAPGAASGEVRRNHPLRPERNPRVVAR